MYSLGIPERQFRRTTQVLGPEAADPIEYESVKQDDGFYLFVINIRKGWLLKPTPIL